MAGVEIHVSNGVELGPTPRVDPDASETRAVELNTGTSFFSTTDSDDQEANATTGWSIADTGLVRNEDATARQTSPRARRIAVHGAPAAPTLACAAVSGTALTPTLNADLGAGSVPAASAFTVRSSPGAELPAPLRSFGGLDASSSRSLQMPSHPSSPRTRAGLDPTSCGKHSRRATVVQPLAPFAFGWLLLLLAATSAAAQPTPTHGRVYEGTKYDQMIIFFSEPLEHELGAPGEPGTFGIPQSLFTVNVNRNGTTTEATDFEWNNVTSNYVMFYSHKNNLYQPHDIITVSYSKPATGTKLQSRATPHEEVATFSDFRVLNFQEFTQDATDMTAPTISSATLNSTGDAAEIVFNEAMDTQIATLSSLFSLDGTSAVVTDHPNFDGGNTTLKLSFNPAVQSTEKPKLSWAPATGTVTYYGWEMHPSATVLVDINQNVMPAFTRPLLRSGETDSTSPTVKDAVLVRNVLTLIFNEDLDRAAVPDKSRFTLAGTGNSAAVATVAFKSSDLTSVELTLDKVPTGTTITVSYAKGTDSNPLEDVAGNEVADFSGRAVTQPDTRSPALKDIGVIDSTLTIRFDEELDTTATPAASRFAVTGFTGPPTVTAVAFKSGDANSVELTLSSAVTASAAIVYLAYAKGTDSNPLKDDHANEVADFSLEWVENRTGTPTLQTATVNGTLLTLTFSEALSTTATPAAAAFSVEGTSATTTVTAVAFKSGDAKSVNLTLSPAVPEGEAGVAVGYDPSLAGAAKILKSAATTPVGVKYFAFQKVKNTLDTNVPQIREAEVNGTVATLTFSKNLDTTAAPDKSRFSIIGTGNATTVSAVAFKGGDATSLVLTLSPAVASHEMGLAVSYMQGNDANPLKDTAATPNKVADFSGFPLTNNTPDTTAPTVASATVSGTVLTLTFSEDLDTTATPAASRFTVSGTASATTVTAVDFKSGDARSVELTLSPAVAAGTTGITVAYAKGSDANPLKDTASPANEVANFSVRMVTNETPEFVTLVSNIGQTSDGDGLVVGLSFGVHWSQAVTFTTGDNTTGYTLSAVDVKLHGSPASSTRVSVYETTGTGNPLPGTSLHVLNNPSSLTGNATNTFSADAGASLDANTTYAVVVEVTDTSARTDLDRTDHDEEDAGAASGWSIGDSRINRQGTGNWGYSTHPEVPMIAIKGKANPPPLVSNTGQTDTGLDVIVGIVAGSSVAIGQTFTTGGNTAGYTLSAVHVKLAPGTPSANTKASIYTTSSGSPSSSLHVLNNPSSLTPSKINTFTADAGASLNANTTYAVVFEATSGQTKLTRTASDAEDAGKASGWSIGDKRHVKSGTGSWTQSTNSDVLKIAIEGAAKTAVRTPPPGQVPQQPPGQPGPGETEPAPEPVKKTVPGAPRDLSAVGGDGQAVLSWSPPEDDGGAPITDYEYRIEGKGDWISIGSSETSHTVSGLKNGAEYIFQVRAVNEIGAGGASRRSTAEVGAVLEFTHFANGDGIASDLVFVNVGTRPVRPALYFYDSGGEPIDAESVVEVTADREITEDGAVTVRTQMEPLAELTVSTHGRGELLTGSVRVTSGAPLGGGLRFDFPHIGVAMAKAATPISDAIFLVRRREGGINTAVAIHNREEEPLEVSCRLLREGVVLEHASLPLAANGQVSWTIDAAFPAVDTSDFAGAVRCDAVERRRFSALALEVDPGAGAFSTLPVFPVNVVPSGSATVLDFAHFANGDGAATDLVLVHVGTWPSGPALTPVHTPIPPMRPAIYFYDTDGNPIAAESVVDVSGDLEVQQDGGLTVRTEMEPLTLLTISTHGRGPLLTGSVRVVSGNRLGGMLRFDLPHIGETVAGAGSPIGDAIFPVRRREGGINTAVAIHNLEGSSRLLRCELLREGVQLDVAMITLAANGQSSWTIDQAFPATDLSDFSGSLRCADVGGEVSPVGGGSFTVVALESDPGAGAFTTLPVFPVEERTARE